MTDNSVRNGIIDQAQQQRITRDTLILQKVNAAHREAFVEKFPGQCEHIMRLIAERLQAILTNKPTTLNDPATWAATAEEIAALSLALHNVYQIHKDIKHVQSNTQ
jgi:hypothetical protein